MEQPPPPPIPPPRLLCLLYIIYDRGFARESIRASSTCRALWNDEQHLSQIVHDVYSVRGRGRSSGSGVYTIRATRLSLCLGVDEGILPERTDGDSSLKLQRLERLIAAGGCVNGSSATESTKPPPFLRPLILATSRGLTDCVAALLATPSIQVNASSKCHGAPGEYTALMRGVIANRIDCVRLLLASPDLEINTENAEDDEATALSYSLQHKHYRLQAMLRNHGAVSGKAGAGKLIFELARAGDTLGLAPLLAEWVGANHSAILNWRDSTGSTALMTTSRLGVIGCVELLLATDGVDVNSALHSFKGWNSLMWGSYAGHLEVCKALLAHPHLQVNLHPPLQGGERSALFWSIDRKRADIQSILRAKGAVLTADEAGRLIFDAAGYKADEKILVALLTEWSGNVAAINWRCSENKGFSALLVACQLKHAFAVKLLLQAEGIDLNARSDRGDTALLWSVMQGDAEVCTLLLAAPGLDVNAKSELGQTALDAAILRKNDEIAQMLRAAGAV